MNIQKRKERVAMLSVASNSFLVLFKVIVGLAIGSVSIISEAIHSGVDLLAAIIAMFSVKTSSEPADERHPFGHGKIENISGFVEALLIFGAAFWIIFEALKKINAPEVMENAEWGVGVMLFSAVMNFIVSQKLFKVGKEADSIALQADAWHLRTDVYTSVGVMFGLSVIWLGHKFFPDPHIHWIDPVAAICVAVLIIHAAYELTMNSLRDLVDVHLPKEEENFIRDMILRETAIHGFHQLRTRKAGHIRFMEFHINVDPHMSVQESHHITRVLKKNIRDKFPESTITIHIEPCDGACTDICLGGCLLPEGKRPKRLHTSA
ncbi:MAG TPA: cation diffusion facilitator family transporter [Smithella sp.]|nr:cation diffusion facilitator family transporter [Smithella sp.]HNY51118.1 cation diffusion facilitator family transporter [Smithella sp.]HOG90649.1 cation diffusion facilitator family transporter [Smithella sp.]HOU49969.1 cation diffusion facilitator family transporter [Smithella sp.]HQG64793.1 cation diffusion facilitator family transporter [Smithella sp.]